jgi:hypothetical protein
VERSGGTDEVSGAEREVLLDRFCKAITVEEGLRAGDPETRVKVDLRMPDPTAGTGERERWRIRTARGRLARAPFETGVLAAFHGADAKKGRCLTVVDLANDSRVASLMAWHFEPPPGRGGTKRPHLLVALAIASDAEDQVLASYMVSAWLLCLVALAIDRCTVAKGQIGVVIDKAIDIGTDDLREFGFRRGPQKDGYEGDYWVLSA